MDASIVHARHTRKRTYFLGSKAEQTVRYLLRETLMKWKFPWEAVIGDNQQHILSRYEVDIPLVVVERETGRCCRFAIEIDCSFTHGSILQKERDARKDAALCKSGWIVHRINMDGMKKDALQRRVRHLAEDIFNVCSRRFRRLRSSARLSDASDETQEGMDQQVSLTPTETGVFQDN